LIFILGYKTVGEIIGEILVDSRLKNTN